MPFRAMLFSVLPLQTFLRNRKAYLRTSNSPVSEKSDETNINKFEMPNERMTTDATVINA